MASPSKSNNNNGNPPINQNKEEMYHLYTLFIKEVKYENGLQPAYEKMTISKEAWHSAKFEMPHGLDATVVAFFELFLPD